MLDDEGNPVTHWDGRTTKPHPVTGKEVPDESARVPVMTYINPRPAVWPEADYVVGNPPFIGPALMRQALGDGYTEAVRKVHKDISSSSDFVMYWWNHAAALARAGKIHRFGFVSTNSLRQKFNRRVLQEHMSGSVDGEGPPSLPPLSLLFAIPDHPWVDAADGAAVRIAMTCATSGEHDGLLRHVVTETAGDGDGYEVELDETRGKIQADLTIGANVAGAVELKANAEVSCPGVKLHGAGFIVTSEEASRLGLGKVEGLEKHIRGYRNGRDLTSIPRCAMVIDLFGLSENEVRTKYPDAYQWVLERVKPERDNNNRKSYRDNWWIHGEARGNFRPALHDLPRYIATVETSKHRFFQFLDASILPDNRLVCFAVADAYNLGVLNAKAHVLWSLTTGGVLEDRPVYNKSLCFETFPFPDPTPTQRQRIRELGEQLDAHRKARQAAHPALTMTGMYNVLEKLQSCEPLTAKEKTFHEQGLVSVLKQLHDDLDAAVFEAYGWPIDLSDEEILERLVSLNSERAAEEARGKVRWLRPEFQNPDGTAEQQGELVVDMGKRTPNVQAPPSNAQRTPWPKTLPDQVRAVREALIEAGQPVTSDVVARRFTRARKDKVGSILETLVTVGQARLTEDGRFVGGQ